MIVLSEYMRPGARLTVTELKRFGRKNHKKGKLDTMPVFP